MLRCASDEAFTSGFLISTSPTLKLLRLEVAIVAEVSGNLSCLMEWEAGSINTRDASSGPPRFLGGVDGGAEELARLGNRGPIAFNVSSVGVRTASRSVAFERTSKFDDVTERGF